MGVNTDGEEMGPGSSLTDGVKLTAQSCEVVQETGNEKSLHQYADGGVGFQDQKPTKGTDFPLIPFPKVPSQSSVLNNEHNQAQREHTDEGESFLSNTTTTLQSGVDIGDGRTELSHGALVNLNADTSADDKGIQLEECSSSLQPAEIMRLLNTNDRDATALGKEKHLSDTSTLKVDSPVKYDIDQIDEEGYTPLYRAALEGHLEGVQDLISRRANPNKPSKGGLRPLHAAAQEGHTHIVDFLIIQGADLNVESDAGQTPLHTAAYYDYTCIVECLIQQGSDVNKADAKGGTPFNAAVQYGHLEAVKYLITEGAKQNRYDGMTPLCAAAQSGHLDIVKFFISKGVDVNEENDTGRIPLNGAAINGHTEVMEYLIQQGSDLNKADAKGWTPFNAAVQGGHLEAVEYLMTKGAKQNGYDGMTPLYAAAQSGHLDIVKFFISNGADVNEEYDEGDIPLHGAAARGHMKVMEYLIQQGSDVNKADAKGWTPFNAAVQNGHLEAVKYLITKGAKQNRYDGITPLYAAAQSGHLDIVKFFISEGADANEEDDKGVIPLRGAATEGQLEVMEYLIQQGSDVNKADAKGGTPFNAAVQYGHLEAVKYLITKGAKQNRYDGMTPLYAAAQSGHLDIVKFFISKGVDVNEENDTGRIPLNGAAINGHTEVMEYLIQQGSDVNKTDAKGWTPFNAAVEGGHLEAVEYLMTKGAKQNRYDGMTPLYAAARSGHLDIVKFVISNGADVNEEHDRGMIPLHGAAIDGNVEVIKYLIQHGSYLNKNANTEWTPLHAAVSNGHLEVVKVLLANGAQGTMFEGLTPLYIATQYDHVDVVKILVSNGFDVNERNECGKSPLHAACYNGNIDIVKFLLHHNAYVNEQDNEGWTPLEAAAQEGHREVEDYLVLNGANIHVRDKDGLTPLLTAVNAGHTQAIECIPSHRGGPDEEETGDPRTGGHQNLITGGYVTVSPKDADTHSGQLASQVDNAEEGNGLTQADIAKRGADELSLKNLTTRTHDDEKDVGRPNVNEHGTPRGGDPNEEDTRDPLSGGHHYGAKQLTRRGYAKKEKKLVKMRDADTQLRTGQLASQVDITEDGNDCNRAENAKRGDSKLSLKSLPTRIHDAKKGGNEEPNPFINAKLKYPDKGEQDPMLDQMEAIRCTWTMTRDTKSNDTDWSSPREPQTWPYIEFDPPSLQTMETGGHQSEEPESKCHSLIDENKKMRESSSPMIVGNDLPINEPSEIESFPKHPPDVAQQKWYDGDPVTSDGTTSNPVWKIRTKRRTSVDRCSSIPALVQTFLQMIIALAIILAGSPVLVAGSSITERVTLQAGKPGVVPFHLSWSPSNTSQIVPFYTLQLKSKPRPFCNNGKSDIEGFKSSSQLPRFTTSVTDLDTSLCVNLMIDNVDTLDEGVYVLTAFWHSFENVRYETIMKEIVVQIPPGRAKCFITLSENSDYLYEVHCRAPTGSVTTTLSCYQNDRKIDIRGNITDNGLITSGIFWLLDYTHFSCCSHDVTLHVNETTCNDFEWPSIKETKRQTVNTVPTSVTTPTPQIESHTESGACRQFMLPSLWHFTYMFVYILAYVTMYYTKSSYVISLSYFTK